MYIFTVFPTSQPAKGHQAEYVSKIKRSDSLVQIHVWELQNFGQTTFHTTKQVCSLQGQNNSVFESTTVLPSLSTRAAAGLAQWAGSTRPPPATSSPSRTSQQAGEETSNSLPVPQAPHICWCNWKLLWWLRTRLLIP